MSDILGPGSNTIAASDDGVAPTVDQFVAADWEVVLFTGNDTVPYSVFQYNLAGYKMSDPTTQSPTVNVRNFSGPDLSSLYFFGYRSGLTSNDSIWITSYSDRFTLINMTGSLPKDVVDTNDKVTTKTGPKRTVSCGAKSGGVCDKQTLDKLGLSDSSAGSDSTASAVTVTVTASMSTAQTSSSTTTSTTAPQNQGNEKESKGTNGGMIAGIVVGLLALLIGVALVVRVWRRKRDRLGKEAAENNSKSGSYIEIGGEERTRAELEGKEKRRLELEGDNAHEMEGQRRRSAVEIEGTEVSRMKDAGQSEQK